MSAFSRHLYPRKIYNGRKISYGLKRPVIRRKLEEAVRKGKVKAQSGANSLTIDLATIKLGRDGDEQLEGKIQERYGLAKDQVRQDVDNWFASQGF